MQREAACRLAFFQNKYRDEEAACSPKRPPQRGSEAKVKLPASDAGCTAPKVNSKPLPPMLPSDTNITMAWSDSISKGEGKTSPQILPVRREQSQNEPCGSYIHPPDPHFVALRTTKDATGIAQG